MSNFAPLSQGQYLDTLLVVTTGGTGATGTESVKARDAAKHSIMHGTASPKRELSSPKCQLCGS